MLRIFSWNIRQGGGSRVIKICSRIVDLGAEIVILSEFRNNASGNQIRSYLLKAGYRYQHVSAALKDVNSAAIFSKLPGDNFLFPNSDPNYSNNVVSTQYEAFEVYGMYLPHKKKHVLFDFLLERLPNQGPSILAGDFNSGKNHIDQKGNSFWYTDKMETLEKIGYIDAFRLINQDVKEYSWYSHQGNGFRYDHTYIHENLSSIVKNCYYLHEWREEGLSDHSPMILELG